MTAAMTPPPLQQTWSGRAPSDAVAMRAAELPNVVAIRARDIDPGLPTPIWSSEPTWGPTDPEVVRSATRERLRGVEWSRITRGSTVNLLANPHGFALCGEAYVVMLEEIERDVVDRTGGRVRLRIAESMGHIENPDWMKIFDLAARFGDVAEVPQIGRGIEIDTRIGRFWLVRDLFSADHFIHTHVSEMREGYLHRMLDRLLKPFGMAYTRVETRSAYHFGYGPRTGQIVSRAVFESSFVQDRYTATIVLDTSPEGVIGVDADNDLDALNRRVSVNLLRNYGTLMRTLAEIDEVTVVFDGHGCFVYAYGAGVAFDNLLYGALDFLDLDNLALMAGLVSVLPTDRGLFLNLNPAIKCLVMNYMPGGVPFIGSIKNIPTILVDGPASKWLINDPCNPSLADYARHAPDLPGAMRDAEEIAGTDKVIIYDGVPGALNVSASLATHLLERAPAVAADVRDRLMPKWLQQRGLG
ncbi:MAG: hypothetical protein ABW328_05715 [Ilumatobacteraceae bacterium]